MVASDAGRDSASRDQLTQLLLSRNESGAKLARPELFRLLADCRPGDVLLIEQVDRLSRLTEADWRKLRAEIEAKQVRIVALDLPTSWNLAIHADDFTARMFGAINAMLLDVLAAGALAKALTAAGIETARGKAAWSPIQVSRLLATIKG